MRGEDITNLLSCPEFLFHRRKAGCRLCITHFGILEPGEPLAHQVRAFPAVRELAFRSAAGIDRALLNTGICSPERFSLRCFAPGALVRVVITVTARVTTYGLNILFCHSNRFEDGIKKRGVDTAKVSGTAPGRWTFNTFRNSVAFPHRSPGIGSGDTNQAEQEIHPDRNDQTK